MSDLRIKTCVLGQVSTNCYLVYNEQTKAAVVIDPADSSDTIIGQCQSLGIVPVCVLLTHGHFDHIQAAEAVAREYGCDIRAGKDEAALLLDPAQNLTGQGGRPLISLKVDVLLEDKAVFELLGVTWEVLFTPGHTAGSVCYYIASEGVLFSGDTLFADSLGRSDLPTGNSAAIIASISERLFILPEDTMVYPGHGGPTSIAHERKYNPVALYLRENR